MKATYPCLPILERHRTAYFDCGQDRLDRWLQNEALTDRNTGRSSTHVWVDEEDIVLGYFTLLPTTIRESDGNSILNLIRPPGFPRKEELPGVLLGKLGLDRSLQGQGLGFDLIADAYYNACEAVMLIGGAVFVVDPMNDKVAGIYREFGFQPVEGSKRLVINFREFNQGTPIADVPGWSQATST